MSRVFNSVDGKYNEGDLLMELQKLYPDFTKVEEIISSNKYFLQTPINSDNQYVLHFACWKNAPSTTVIKIINYYPIAVQQKDMFGYYPLHSACLGKQSESVIQILIKKYPMAVQQKNTYGWYPLYVALWNNQSESVIQLLINEYPMAVHQKDIDEGYPLHLACRKHHSENVILALIDINLLPIKAKDQKGYTPLQYAKWEGQSKTIIDILTTLMEKSDYDLKNRIDIPMPVLINGFYNKRRHDCFHWLLMKSSLK
jgi:ankyrin repeat protein